MKNATYKLCPLLSSENFFHTTHVSRNAAQQHHREKENLLSLRLFMFQWLDWKICPERSHTWNTLENSFLHFSLQCSDKMVRGWTYFLLSAKMCRRCSTNLVKGIFFFFWRWLGITCHRKGVHILQWLRLYFILSFLFLHFSLLKKKF